jgi:ketosteroid isomerase-like protein
MGSQHVTVETLQKICDAFNQHDLDTIMSFFSENCILETPAGPAPWGQRFEGQADVRAGLAARFEGIPDVHYGNDRHWVCGDFGVSEWTITGTTTSGQKIEARGCDHWTFLEGQIIKKDSYWKTVNS